MLDVKESSDLSNLDFREHLLLVWGSSSSIFGEKVLAAAAGKVYKTKKSRFFIFTFNVDMKLTNFNLKYEDKKIDQRRF